MTLYPPNEKSRQEPNKINFTTWDIETDFPFNPEKVLMIGFYNGVKYKSWKNFDSNDEIFDWFLGEVLKKKYYGYNHYSHFGGKFDMIYMLDTLKKYDYQFDIIDVNGRILEIEVFKNDDSRLKGKTFHFCDSFALMPKSLKDITHSFNVPHLKLSHEFDLKDGNKEESNFTCLDHGLENCFECYTKYDVMGLYESIKIFEEIINKHNGELKLTIASTALDIFKNGYLKSILNSLHDLEIGKNINDEKIILNVEELIRNYYFGGRVEIFKRYCEYEFYYDVNSLYPYTMLSPMPISEPIFCLPENINVKKDMGFVNCDIEFWNENKIPLIPYKLKLKYSKKLIYPLGKWKAWLDLDMYRKALEVGYKLKINHGIIFNVEPIFKNYIEDFYKLRFMNDAMSLIAKLLMNSLYGKFAQKRDRKQIIKFLGCEDLNYCKNKCGHKNDDGECLLTVYNLEENLYQVETISKSKHIIPSISAHITTLSQLKLYDFIEKCNGDITYCDTDSIITSKKLPTSKNLGELKMEYEIEKGVFLLPKTYYFKGFDLKKQENVEKITMKGFVKNVFTFDDFYNAIINNDLSKFNYKIKKLWGFKESMKRNNKFCTYADKINSLKTGYDKRFICEDRINTKPLVISDGILVNNCLR